MFESLKLGDLFLDPMVSFDRIFQGPLKFFSEAKLMQSGGFQVTQAKISLINLRLRDLTPFLETLVFLFEDGQINILNSDSSRLLVDCHPLSIYFLEAFFHVGDLFPLAHR